MAKRRPGFSKRKARGQVALFHRQARSAAKRGDCARVRSLMFKAKRLKVRGVIGRFRKLQTRCRRVSRRSKA